MAKSNVSVKDSTGVLVTSGHIDTAGGDVLIGGQKVTNIYQNPDYAALVEQIKDYEDLFDAALRPRESACGSAKRSKILKKRKKDFEQQVIQMAETFLQIADDSSERLQQARACFEQGDLERSQCLARCADLGGRTGKVAQIIGARRRKIAQQRPRVFGESASDRAGFCTTPTDSKIVARTLKNR
jgi:hypothetical protein